MKPSALFPHLLESAIKHGALKDQSVKIIGAMSGAMATSRCHLFIRPQRHQIHFVKMGSLHFGTLSPGINFYYSFS